MEKKMKTIPMVICRECKEKLEENFENFNYQSYITKRFKKICRDCEYIKQRVSVIRDYPGIRSEIKSFLSMSNKERVKQNLA